MNFFKKLFENLNEGLNLNSSKEGLNYATSDKGLNSATSSALKKDNSTQIKENSDKKSLVKFAKNLNSQELNLNTFKESPTQQIQLRKIQLRTKREFL